MKKISLAILLAVTVLFSGCHKIIDWRCVNLMIEVIDDQGHYLASPENKHLLEGTTIEFEGKVIPLELETAPVTRTLPPEYRDRFFVGETFPFGNCLVFGELWGDDEYKDLPFKITWPDGSSDVITYTRKLNSANISAKEIWKLNGEECKNPVVIRKDFAE